MILQSVTTRLISWAGIAIFALIPLAFVMADSSDHIGPDPIQSENCVTITPGRSVTCLGHFVGQNSDDRPSLTINCGPGIFFLITHHQQPVESSVRLVRLIFDHGEITRQWLAISKSQSAYLVFDGGSSSDDYQWIIRLIGNLMTPQSSRLGFSFNDSGIEGTFVFDYSDRNLIGQLAPKC